MTEIKTIAFTGLRPKKLPLVDKRDGPEFFLLKEDIRRRVVRLIEEENARRFISGMALGVDQLCAEIVLELKEKYQGITLEAALPCPEQDKVWVSQCRERYRELLSKCDVIYIVGEGYTPQCMHVRNKYMVDKCDAVLAVWDGKPGGTANTVKLAKKLGKEVIVIDPCDDVLQIDLSMGNL